MSQCRNPISTPDNQCPYTNPSPGYCNLKCPQNPQPLVWPTLPPPRHSKDFKKPPYVAGESIEKSPCSGCGDKRNIAEVKSSPVKLEEFLAGE